MLFFLYGNVTFRRLCCIVSNIYIRHVCMGPLLRRRTLTSVPSIDKRSNFSTSAHLFITPTAPRWLHTRCHLLPVSGHDVTHRLRDGALHLIVPRAVGIISFFLLFFPDRTSTIKASFSVRGRSWKSYQISECFEQKTLVSFFNSVKTAKQPNVSD